CNVGDLEVARAFRSNKAQSASTSRNRIASRSATCKRRISKHFRGTLNTVSGPGGRWFKSTRPDQIRYRSQPLLVRMLFIPVGNPALPFCYLCLCQPRTKSGATVYRTPLGSESEPHVRFDQIRLCAQPVEQDHSEIQH